MRNHYRFIAFFVLIMLFFINNINANEYRVITFSNGDQYKGFIDSNGLKNGQGTYIWANGDQYAGDWVNDHRTGYGIFTWANGNQYRGGWLNSRMNGKGVMIYTNGTRLEGEWVNGEYRQNPELEQAKAEYDSALVAYNQALKDLEDAQNFRDTSTFFSILTKRPILRGLSHLDLKVAENNVDTAKARLDAAKEKLDELNYKY